jgi:outer membrane protein assembly factor BamA
MGENRLLSTRHSSIAIGFALTCALSGPVAHARLFPSLSSRATLLELPRAASVPSDAELEAARARIGLVHFDARDVFDHESADEDTSLSRLANRLHVSTREDTIASQLLFKPGDAYQPSLLEESARILRDTRYLGDAVIRPVAFHDGVVDIEVTTRDVWTFSPGVSFGRHGGANTSGFEIEDLNLLGRGTQLGVGFKSGVDRDSKEIHYRDRQLGKSWWNLTTTYSDNSDGRLAELSLDRPFYALDSRWAAGLSLLDDRRTDTRYDLGKPVDRFETQERGSTIYWGRSEGLDRGWARRLSFGLTFEDHEFHDAPSATPALLLPADRRLVYPWVAAEWVENAFRTARNRDQIEKTEDYSLGWRASAKLGFANGALGSDRDAFVFESSVSKGLAMTERQSLTFGAGLSGRYEDGAVAGGILDIDTRYYFRESPRRLFFMNLSASAGENLDPERQILLGGDNGLRGYPLRYQSGTGRWQFTAEQRFFTNWYPFQLFNVGAAVFYDMGATWGRDPVGTPSQGLLRDVGFGLRFGNSRSALGSVLHVDVAYPLDGERSAKNLQFLIDTKKSF